MEVIAVYNQFHQALRSFIRSKINTKEDVDDILQNVFIKISGGIAGLSHSEKLTSWIYAIARNAITDYYRRKYSQEDTLGIDENLERTLPTLEDGDSTHALESCVHSMIAMLPERYREIIIDSEIHGIRQKDLALKYNMEYSSMRSRVQRAREHLKKLFYDCCVIQIDVRGNVMAAHSKKSRDSSCASCE